MALAEKQAGLAEEQAGPVDVSAVATHLARQIDAAALETDPFDHVYVRDMLPAEVYRRALALRPDTGAYRELRKRDSIRPDGTSPRLKFELLPEFIGSLPADRRDFWRDLTRALEDDRVADAFRRKFDRALARRFGEGRGRVGMYPIPMLLRDTAGYRISIHSDTLRKGITVQLYLPQDDTQAHLGTIFHRRDAAGALVEATRMPFLPNSLYAFPVTLDSFHSLGTMTEADGARHSLMLTYYVEQGVADTIRRHGKRALNAAASRLRALLG